MDGVFHLLDLYSQAHAVQHLLKGRTAQEKLAWIAARGTLTTHVFTSHDSSFTTYKFVSPFGFECMFIIDGDEIKFPGRCSPNE